MERNDPVGSLVLHSFFLGRVVACAAKYFRD